MTDQAVRDERAGAATDRAATSSLATAPADADAAADRRPGPPPGRVGGVRRVLAEPLAWWRRLTSMRTALVLLFLLALVAVPGSAFPQRNIAPERVDEYLADHTTAGPLLDRLSAFDVYRSPWFAAVYLLLFVSLVGCVVPRLRVHARALVRRPPEAPRRFDRLPVSGRVPVPADADPAAAAAAIAGRLRRSRWRTVVRTERSGALTVSAEKGYLRETGNLVFHFALIAVLAGVAAGSLWGWKASVLVTEGETVCATTQAFDRFTPGSRVDGTSLPEVCVALDDFRATYLPNGQPTSYEADIRHVEGARAGTADPDRPYRLRVNEPLRIRGANVYLTNHGYAPVLRYTDRYGTVFTDVPPFLPGDDAGLTSEGAYLLPDANQDPDGTTRTRGVEMAFTGFFLPTAPTSGPPIRSTYPAADRPAVTLLAYRGDTGLNTGIPGSVYSVDQAQVDKGALKPLGSKLLRPGQTWTLDDGSSLTFVGVKEFASVQLGHDPGDKLLLAGAVAMVLGLIGSLTVRRRRVWFRVAGVDGRTVVDAGGLARTDSPAYAEEFRRLVEAAAAAVPAARADATGPSDAAVPTGPAAPSGAAPSGEGRFPPGPSAGTAPSSGRRPATATSTSLSSDGQGPTTSPCGSAEPSGGAGPDPTPPTDPGTER